MRKNIVIVGLIILGLAGGFFILPLALGGLTGRFLPGRFPGVRPRLRILPILLLTIGTIITLVGVSLKDSKEKDNGFKMKY